MDPNISKNFKSTPLHLAAEQGHREVVGLLLEGGADPNKADKDGRTPLLRTNHNDVVQLILQYQTGKSIVTSQSQRR